MGIRRTFLWLWQLFDPLFYIFSRLHYIYIDKDNRSVFRVRVTKYKGNNVILSDGTLINKNDLLLKIHLHNVRLLNEIKKIKNDIYRARHIYKSVVRSMPALAKYLNEHPNEVNIKGIIGITTINKVVGLMGFESYTPSNQIYSRLKKFGQLPIFILSFSTFQEIKSNKLNYLFMSKEKLFTKYGQDSTEK